MIALCMGVNCGVNKDLYVLNSIFRSQMQFVFHITELFNINQSNAT